MLVRLFALIAAGLAVVGPAFADDHPTSAMDALEVMADLTLIDGTCQNVVVNLGVGLRFAAARGIADTAILPGGQRRSEFEAVLRARKASFGADELCGQIAKNYIDALPASVVPIYRRAEARP